MLKIFLKELNEQMSILEKKVCLSYWDSSISGKKEDYKKYELASIVYDEYFCDKSRFEKLKSFEFELSNADVEIKRQYQLFYDIFL
jgi:hypothetical protein